MINVAELLDDPDLAFPFTIIRDPGGTEHRGTYVHGDPVVIQAWGVITPASSLDIQMFPEGDRVTGFILVATATPLKESSSGPPEIIADIIVYLGKRYRIERLMPLNQYGFNRAICSLMGGG